MPDPIPGKDVPVAFPERRKVELKTSAAQEPIAAALVAAPRRSGVSNSGLGQAHLGELMEDWRGSHILAFASYNAGGGNVSKWIKAYGDPRSPGVDAVDWVERIPFSETRNYVQRVMENLNVYRQRLNKRSLPAPATADATRPDG